MSTESAAPRPLSPIATGAVLGALVGIGEVALGVTSSASAVTRHYLLEAVLLYGSCGGLVGIAVAVLARLARRRPPSSAASLAVLIGFFIFLTVGGYVSVYHLPQITDPRSLIVTGLIFVATVALAFALHRLLRALRIDRWRARRGVRRAGWVVLAVLTAVVVLGTTLPSRAGHVEVIHPGAGFHRNVVFIVVDALRYDHLSMNGYARETTPQLDAWAHEAVVFDRAGAHAPWTKPSTATLLTSLYPSTHGVNPMASAVPETVELLPATLRRYGYRTAIFTANHFITSPFGFGRGTEFFYSSSPPRLGRLLLGHLMHQAGVRLSPLERFVVFLETVERSVVDADRPDGGLDAESLTRAFWGWLDEIGDERFFAYLHYMEPHAPYDPPEPYDTIFMPPHLIGKPKVTDFPTFDGFLPFDPGPEISADSLANMLALYDGSIRLADFWMGELIRDLKSRGLYERTLIVLTADHGEEFYDHGGWGHGQSLYEELLHVPLMLSGPELTDAAGQRFGHSVRHVDIVPTILDVCGLPPAEGAVGRSLLPIVRGEEPQAPPRVVFSEVDFGGHFARSLREGPRKVIRAQRGGDRRTLAFNLDEDPGETRDLTGPGTLWTERMLTRMDEFRQIAASQAVPGVNIVIDEATRERLKAIGYLK